MLTRAQRKSKECADDEVAARLSNLAIREPPTVAIPKFRNAPITPETSGYETKFVRPPRKQAERLVIAIDYGTTCCAVSYVKAPIKVANVAKILVRAVQGYPAADDRHHRQDDVPTVSVYQDHTGRRYLWGHEVAQEIRGPYRQMLFDKPRIRGPKLLLSDEKHLREHQKDLNNMLVQSNVTLNDAIADFLRVLWENASKDIIATYGESDFVSLRKDLVISVPPGWKAKAVRTMQQAALTARLPHPQIVAEQEAAVLAVLIEQDLIRDKLREGDVMLVVDAGGGTVDMATYKLNRRKPFRVSELSVSTSKFSGSNMINLSFQKWFKEKLSLRRSSYPKKSDKDLAQMVQIATDQFEWEKRKFSGPGDRDSGVEVRGLITSRDGCFEDDFVVVPSDKMLSWFDDLIVNDMIPRARKCISTAHATANEPAEFPLIKYIIVVGGFSASRYLQKVFQDSFHFPSDDADPPYHIDVIFPANNNETIVSRGAIFRALEPNFLALRRLRTSYGIKWDEKYDPNVHDASLKEFDDQDNDYVVRDCIHWICKAGEDLTQTQVFGDTKMHWTVDADYDFHSGALSDEFSCELYMSDETNPRDHQTIEQMEKESCHLELCTTLHANLSEIDPSKLESTTSASGKPCKVIYYCLKSSISGVETTWELSFPNLPGAQTQKCSVNISAAFNPSEAAC